MSEVSDEYDHDGDLTPGMNSYFGEWTQQDVQESLDDPDGRVCYVCHRRPATDLDGGKCQHCFDND